MGFIKKPCGTLQTAGEIYSSRRYSHEDTRVFVILELLLYCEMIDKMRVMVLEQEMRFPFHIVKISSKTLLAFFPFPIVLPPGNKISYLPSSGSI